MRRSGVGVLLAAGIVAACVSWQGVKTPPPEYLAQPLVPDKLRVHTDSGEVILTEPRLVEDSLVGMRGPRYSGGDPVRVAIPLRRIKSLEVQRGNTTGTIAAVTLAVLGAGVVALAAFAGSINTTPSGSCPTVYSWTGNGWRLDSGTFAGALVRALQRTDLDNLDFAAPDGRLLRLRVTNELPEVDHVDALEVIAVDHAPGVVIAPDPAGRVHAFRGRILPISAVDFRGEDALDRVRDADDWSWRSNPARRDSSRTADVRDGLVLRFPRPHGAATAHLILDARNTEWAAWLLREWVSAHGASLEAWYDSLNADAATARRAFQPIAREALLGASIETSFGWVPLGQFAEVGPEAGKRQILHFDLPATAGDTVVIRLESAPALWAIDRVAMAFGPDEAMRVRTLALREARTPVGADVAGPLGATDGRELTLTRGERAELSFEVPAAAAATERSFLLRSTGWYRLDPFPAAVGDAAMLSRIANEPLALSRIAVGRLNDALAPLRQQAPRWR